MPIFNVVSLNEEDFEFTFSQLKVSPQSFAEGSVMQTEVTSRGVKMHPFMQGTRRSFPILARFEGGANRL